MAYIFNQHECGFCLAEVQHGATVCAHCGAYKSTVSDGLGGFFSTLWPALFLLVFGGIWAMGIWNSVIESSRNVALWEFAVTLVAIAIGGGGFFLAFKNLFRPVWLRRN